MLSALFATRIDFSVHVLYNLGQVDQDEMEVRTHVYGHGKLFL